MTAAPTRTADRGPLQMWLHVNGGEVLSVTTGGARVLARQLLAIADHVDLSDLTTP